jgi:hypothetical protein
MGMWVVGFRLMLRLELRLDMLLMLRLLVLVLILMVVLLTSEARLITRKVRLMLLMLV